MEKLLKNIIDQQNKINRNIFKLIESNRKEIKRLRKRIRRMNNEI